MKYLSMILIAVLFMLIAAPSLSARELQFEIEAEAALLIEVHSGTLIWETNSRQRLYPASLTKLMSLLLVMEHLKQEKVSLQDVVEISARASDMGGAEIFLSEGDLVTLEELITGMAVGSANDAAVAVAEHLAGSVEAFVEMMNEKARELGLADSNFSNPHGLHHPGHYTTAHDIAVISLALLRHPSIHDYLSIWMDEHFLQGKIKSGEVFLSNTNRMVHDYQGCDGLKTGFTSEAGNNISVTAQRGQTRFLAIVMGSPTVNDRYESARKLLDYGFDHFKSVPLLDEGATVAELPVDKGELGSVRIITPVKLSLLMAKNEPEEFRQEICLPALLLPPLREKEKVGELLVYYGEENKVAFDLVVEQAVNRAGLAVLIKRVFAHWLRFGR